MKLSIQEEDEDSDDNNKMNNGRYLNFLNITQNDFYNVP